MCTHWTDMTSLDESCHRVTSYCQCRWANIKACNTTNMRHRHKIKSDTNVESFVILILLKIVRMCRPISPNNSMPMNKICSRFIHLLGCFFCFFFYNVLNNISFKPLRLQEAGLCAGGNTRQSAFCCKTFQRTTTEEVRMIFYSI